MKLIVIGSGGHAGVVIDAVWHSKAWEIEGLIDETIPAFGWRHGQRLLNKWDIMQNQGAYKFFVAIGDRAVRESYSKLTGLSMVNILHPNSIQADVPRCRGTFFGAYSVVGPGCKVGDFCILNTGAILPHDSTLGDYSHLCPRVIMGGHVTIGRRTMIGLGAMIRDHITIGDNCVIGMGSVVLHDVPNNTTGWGNPFRAQ